MSEHVDSFEESGPLTRREFTLEAALALLAGCVITISDGCGGGTTSPTPVAPPADITGVISANHNHVGVITSAQITAGNAITFSIQGTAVHNHTLSMTQADMTTLKNRQSVSRESSTDPSNTYGLHSHVVTFTPA
jgi:hypothetical protein